MKGFFLTHAAKADLKAIARYTEKTWGREQRNRYLMQMDATFRRLVELPNLGRQCDEISAGYRQFPVGKHLIFYRTHPEEVEIVRILHERMDVEQLSG